MMNVLYQLGLAIIEHFSNPRISGLKFVNQYEIVGLMVI